MRVKMCNFVNIVRHHQPQQDVDTIEPCQKNMAIVGDNSTMITVLILKQILSMTGKPDTDTLG